MFGYLCSSLLDRVDAQRGQLATDGDISAHACLHRVHVVGTIAGDNAPYEHSPQTHFKPVVTLLIPVSQNVINGMHRK